MKRVNYLKTALALFLLLSSCLTAAEGGERKTKSFTVSKGGKLNVNVNLGEINIQTWEKNEVLLSVTGLSEDSFKNLRTSLEGSELKIVLDNNEDDEDESDVSFTFSVPSKFNLEVKTNSGEINIKNNLEGNATLYTYGGEITTKNITGSVKVETYGGEIQVGDVGGDCNLNTYGGDIKLGNVKGKNVKVSTNGGDIKVTKSQYGIDAKTHGGDIVVNDAGGDSELITYGGDVRVESAVGNIRMETYGGNLTIKKANGKVSGKSNAGDIDFKNIEGSVDVKTFYGNIYVELNPSKNSESNIATTSGSIELTVPSSAKTNIEARVNVKGSWKYSRDEHKINSEFNSDSYTTDDKKHNIVGKYVLNGGGSKINLSTINDNITIRKK